MIVTVLEKTWKYEAILNERFLEMEINSIEHLYNAYKCSKIFYWVEMDLSQKTRKVI